MLRLAPRGRVLCLGTDADALLAQVIQALAVGNSVLAVAPGAHKALEPLLGKGLPLEALDGMAADEHLATLDVDLVALVADAEELRAVRKVLAERDGPIIRLVTQPIEPSAYAVERAVCVDTTAAGGNASLLAAAE